MAAESWFWIMAGVIVLMSLASAIKLIRQFLFFFFIAFAGLLAFHYWQDPASGGAILASTGGGLVLTRMLRKKITGGFL